MLFKNMQSTPSSQNLSPAKDNVWYALSTITGETPWLARETPSIDKKIFEIDLKRANNARDKVFIHEDNVRLWHGYMFHLYKKEIKEVNEHYGLDNAGEILERHKKENSIIELSDADINKIEQKLRDQGFCTPVKINGSIDFENIIFEKPVDFSGFKFLHPVNFSGSTFISDVRFDMSEFGSSDFENCQFQSNASFVKCVFGNSTKFNGSKFNGPVTTFTKARFKCGIVSFDDVLFASITSFKDCSFLKTAIFTNCDFKGILNFSNSKFSSMPPMFFGSKILNTVSWYQTKFPKKMTIVKNQTISDILMGLNILHHEHKQENVGILAYEYLGNLMGKLGRHHDKHLFFRLEMRERRRLEKNLIIKAINGLYEVLCNYGYGPVRAGFLWLFNLFGLTALLYIPRRGYEFAPKSPENWWTAILLWWEALPLGVASAFSFLGLSRGALKESIEDFPSETLLIPYGFSSSLQTILSTILLFFFLLAVRNRFRMN